MITTANRGYWATGITLLWSPRAHWSNGTSRPGWNATVDFYDDGFRDDDTDAWQISTQGHLQTRYFVTDGEHEPGIGAALDALLRDARRFGIEFKDPQLYYRGDGESEDYPPPDGWRDMLAEQAERLGWRTPYRKIVIDAHHKEIEQ